MDAMEHDLHRPCRLPHRPAHEGNVQTHHPRSAREGTRLRTARRPSCGESQNRYCAQGRTTAAHALH
jgi:hypothetical protein